MLSLTRLYYAYLKPIYVMIKNLISISLCLLFISYSWAQEPKNDKEKAKTDGYEFTDTKIAKYTPVKDQSRSGTCWSFSGLAFLESEMLRQGKPEVDLSEMFIVRMTYLEKAEKYVRMHGTGNFSAGGATHDVMNIIKKYGIVPEEAYPGLNYGSTKHNHGELDAVLSAYIKTIVDRKSQITPAWKEGFNGILDAYLGKFPDKFTYQGKEYTPKSFAESLGLNMDDYVSVTSFTHHPFYETFAIEVPDNWAWGESYNVPLNDFNRILNNAIDNGYTIFWAADVSEKGFNYNKGYAVIPEEKKIESEAGTEKARWTALSPEERKAAKQKGPGKEQEITQELRQVAYDKFETTDDHGMQIVGKAVDQNGTTYYKVKNSWGDSGVYKGFFYASEPYVLYKTMNMVVNKKAIPKDIVKKLNLK